MLIKFIYKEIIKQGVLISEGQPVRMVKWIKWFKWINSIEVIDNVGKRPREI